MTVNYTVCAYRLAARILPGALREDALTMAGKIAELRAREINSAEALVYVSDVSSALKALPGGRMWVETYLEEIRESEDREFAELDAVNGAATRAGAFQPLEFAEGVPPDA